MNSNLIQGKAFLWKLLSSLLLFLLSHFSPPSHHQWFNFAKGFNFFFFFLYCTVWSMSMKLKLHSFIFGSIFHELNGAQFLFCCQLFFWYFYLIFSKHFSIYAQISEFNFLRHMLSGKLPFLSFQFFMSEIRSQYFYFPFFSVRIVLCCI